ncbi:unnamed protein product [Plutella xylostella]|uniref:(diamondback moth) hypothetical protein n=1 Tax=Plutella xylostella TaxID=51655 RepID=A0A8S4GFK3_PLUXY|nr:unnamed protein product [Plutella xylostella]
MKILVDQWKLMTFKDIKSIPTTIDLIEHKYLLTSDMCNQLEEISSNLKCKKRLETVRKSLDKSIFLFESLSHLTSTKRTKRGWFDGIGSVLKTVFGTLDSDDAVYYDQVIQKVISDESEIFNVMKNQIQITQSAIQNFNSTVNKINENDKLLNSNFQTIYQFIDKFDSNITIIDIRTTLNSHFGILNAMLSAVIDDINIVTNSILFAKQDVLHPAIISPKQIFIELTKNINFLKQNKEFPLPLNLEDIHILIDISTLNVFYINNKLVFVLNIPLVTPQEYELYHVLPLPTPHSFQDLTFALVQPTKKYIGLPTNKHSYVQFNDISRCKTLSREHFICDDVNEYSVISNPSCESQILTQIFKTLPKECNTKFIYGDVEIWQKLINNKWIYIYSKPTKLTIDCTNNDIKEYKLINTGIIQLDKNCKGYANLIQITATSDIISNFTSPSFDLDLTKDDCCNDIKLNKTKHLFTPINIGNVQLDDLNRASVKLHSIEEHIDTMQSNKANLKPHFHITYLVYTLSGLALLFVMYKICKRCRRRTNGCCIQIFNQCNNTRRSNVEPVVEFRTVKDYPAEPTTSFTIPQPSSRLVRSPSLDSKRKYEYNLEN